MSPDQLSVKGTEHGHQAALFAWAAMAQRHGFAIADRMEAYSKDGMRDLASWQGLPVPALEWLFAIPNGGLRTPQAAAMLKAEGVRAGVADVCLPVPRYVGGSTGGISYCGLYIEMKKPKGGSQSAEQKAFEQHCAMNSYIYRLCKSWREAADVVKEYLTTRAD